MGGMCIKDIVFLAKDFKGSPYNDFGNEKNFFFSLPAQIQVIQGEKLLPDDFTIAGNPKLNQIASSHPMEGRTTKCTFSRF